MLFVPFGLYLGLLAPPWPSLKLAAVVAGSSFALETVQYVLAVGSSDITDLIVNTSGSLAGLGLLTLARRQLQDRTEVVVMRVCAVGTVLLVLSARIFIASPLHYAPVRDVDMPIVSSRSAPPQTAPLAGSIFRSSQQ